MLSNALLAHYDVALGLKIGLLSCIPVVAVIYIGESDRCSELRRTLASRWFIHPKK